MNLRRPPAVPLVELPSGKLKEANQFNDLLENETRATRVYKILRNTAIVGGLTLAGVGALFSAKAESDASKPIPAAESQARPGEDDLFPAGVIVLAAIGGLGAEAMRRNHGSQAEDAAIGLQDVFIDSGLDIPDELRSHPIYANY